MKKVVLLLTILLTLLVSCTVNIQKIPAPSEYLIIKEKHLDLGIYESYYFRTDRIIDSLNTLGQNGYELVSIFSEIETVFPNFGHSEYVTGIKSNSRTSSINFVLKRKLGYDSFKIKVK